MSGSRPGGASLVSPETRARVRLLGEPVALFLGRLGLTPNGLTLVGFGITLVAAVLAAAGFWLAAGVVVLAGGVFDLFDGTLARATGRASAFGAFLDSVFDRWGEGLTYLGIVIGAGRAGFELGAGLAAWAMLAAFQVSYTRSKAEGLGFVQGTGMAAVGLAPREVRLVVLTVGLVFAGIGGVEPSFSGGSVALGLALGLLGLLATITAIQRMLHVRALASPADSTGPAARTPRTED